MHHSTCRPDQRCQLSILNYTEILLLAYNLAILFNTKNSTLKIPSSLNVFSKTWSCFFLKFSHAYYKWSRAGSLTSVKKVNDSCVGVAHSYSCSQQNKAPKLPAKIYPPKNWQQPVEKNKTHLRNNAQALLEIMLSTLLVSYILL